VRLLLLIVVLFAGPAIAQVQVDNAWARATPPGAKIGAGYLTLRAAAADRLLGASSPAAERVEMHQTLREGDIARMREVKAVDVPAGKTVEFKPNGSHLMLVNLKAPLKAGARVPLTLRFEKAGEVKAELEVRPLGTASHDQHKGH
jgi:periplasmic copper chaperone A